MLIIIRIQGGLGNQMFQYALGLSIEKEGYHDLIKYDISDYYRNHAHTGYSLKKYFNIDLPIATKEEIRKVYSGAIYEDSFSKQSEIVKNLINKYYHYKEKAVSMFSSSYRNCQLTDFRHNIFNDALLHIISDGDFYIKGYFQNYRYFKDILSELRKVFCFNGILNPEDETLLTEIQNTYSVAIHVRRGDYAGTGFELCSLNYFKKAVTLIPRLKEAQFYVFSDDKDYIKKNFSFLDDYVFCDHGSENCNIDLYLMSQCRCNIISNSTFGLWGALLNNNNEKVIAPKYWFKNSTSLCQMDLPNDWEILDNSKL